MAEPLTADQLRDLLRQPQGIGSDRFMVLRSVAALVNDPDNQSIAREMVLRALEFREQFGEHAVALDALARELGYFPYCDPNNLDLKDRFAYEVHRPANLQDIVFHREQAIVYRRLLAGESIILSAPTSFGKSRIIDAVIATERYNNIAVIVPTVALIDETRRRLSQFHDTYKIITHLSQPPGARNIFILTAERAVAYDRFPPIDFLVVDEFYKLDALDENQARTVALNQAFYKLRKKTTQFYLLGPSIKTIPSGAEDSFRCFFYQTNYATVVAEEKRVESEGDDIGRLIELARGLDEATLIFCRSPARVNAVAHAFLDAGLGREVAGLRSAADWVAGTYHPDWVFSNAMLKGIGVHHGKLPRALAHFAVQAFNDEKLKFLICTSTLIEGVNTKAKNVIVFDNAIAKKKIDFFTFNNIRGRSGRMFQHFVGRIFVFHEPPEENLPFVDFPLLAQDERVPDSLLIQIDERDLASHAKSRVEKFAQQGVLPIEVLRKNSGIDPDMQLALAEKIRGEAATMAPFLSWEEPTYVQLKYACELIWEYLVPEKRRAGVFSGGQLAVKLWQLRMTPSVRARVLEELVPGQYAAKTPDEAVERILEFDRTWANFEFPKYLMALSRIQESVLQRLGQPHGDYSAYAGRCEALFQNPVSIALEEYGIPLQVAEKLRPFLGKDLDLDGTIAALRGLDPSKCQLSPFEVDLVADAKTAL